MATNRHLALHQMARRGWQRRLGAFAVVAALVGTSVPAQAFAPDAAEVERLYVQGQERKEAKDYKGAAESWTRLLKLLDESGENQAIRESVIINVLDSHLSAYNLLVDAEGTKDISHLRTGKQTLDQYYAEFTRVHGDRVAVSAAVQDSAARLEAALAEAEAKPDEPPPPEVADDPDAGTVKPTTTTSDVPPPRSGPADSGLGLIIGGAGLGVLGIGAIIMIPVGSALGKTAEDDFNDAQEAKQEAEAANDTTLVGIAEGDIDDAETAGARANAVLITGAVLAPLLIGGSVALIVLGVRKRNRSRQASVRSIDTLTAAPAIGPKFSGFSLSGRF